MAAVRMLCVECVDGNEFEGFVSVSIDFHSHDYPEMPFHLGSNRFGGARLIKYGLARRRIYFNGTETFPTKINCKEFCFC
jgi:hypothetical protein